METIKNPLIRSERVYDVLKYAAMVVLPAFAALYLILSELWGLPFGPQVVGTITAFDAFLGALLQIDANRFANSEERFDGHVEVDETDDKRVVKFALDGDPDEFLDNKNQLVLKVDRRAR